MFVNLKSLSTFPLYIIIKNLFKKKKFQNNNDYQNNYLINENLEGDSTSNINEEDIDMKEEKSNTENEDINKIDIETA